MTQFFGLCATACMMVALVLATDASQATKGGGEPKVGDKAPAFEAVNDQGKPWKSSDVVGKKIVVVYFYPADFTKGCTDQACGFRDNMKPLTDKGVEVVGVSGDSVKAHAAFKKEHNLPFTLLSDTEGKVASKFGVPFNKKQGTIKSPQGETFIREGTVPRTTIVINKDGTIAARYAVKDAGGDSKEILKIVEKLQK